MASVHNAWESLTALHFCILYSVYASLRLKGSFIRSPAGCLVLCSCCPGVFSLNDTPTDNYDITAALADHMPGRVVLLPKRIAS